MRYNDVGLAAALGLALAFATPELVRSQTSDLRGVAGGSASRPDTLKQTDQPPISPQPPCEPGGPYVFRGKGRCGSRRGRLGSPLP